MRDGVETMKRTGCKQALVVPGRFDESLAWDYQTANVVEHLRACMEICEPAGLVLVLEPLNPKNHPGLFLTKIPQAYQICKAVNSPSCKIIDDIYHQQITEGNLIPNIEAAWDEIAAFHLGDNPGPQGADHRRDQLPQRLQVHPRQGLPGRPVHGARPEQAGQRGRARRHRRVPRVRPVLTERGDMSDNDQTSVTRRDFVKTAAAASVAASLPPTSACSPPGSDAIKVGVIGCGGRGTGAAHRLPQGRPGRRDRRPRRPRARPGRQRRSSG